MSDPTPTAEATLRAAFTGSGDTVEVSGHDHCVGHHHLTVRIVSPRFAGVSRIQRHRLVQDLLRAQFDADEIHALILELKTPDEV